MLLWAVPLSFVGPQQFMRSERLCVGFRDTLARAGASRRTRDQFAARFILTPPSRVAAGFPS
jgi:hypothetical protein